MNFVTVPSDFKLPSILENYRPVSGRFDELLNDQNRIGKHWQPFFRQLGQTTTDTLDQKAQSVAAAIAADGVTYNVYDDPRGIARPWEVDLLPLVLQATEWDQLAAAVAQRATLLDKVLADLYGPQSLLTEGLLPPALVFGQPGFKWPCQGVTPPGGRYLHFYAVDLARSPDGHWWVIADRTQAPSGAGYALQNRMVISRAFPSAFHSLPARNLADFFRDLQGHLSEHAPSGPDTPLCVLLTPGRYNETYFEHVFLARHLGFPLVEGQDLTVRNDTVYLKTLQGLRQIHVIFRRLDDGFCDPLELRADSVLGVPGLLGAVRAGKVLVANALGSGLMESAAMFGFLPGIAERLLGEPLTMPSVATWWCGEPPALEWVVEHLDELVIKPSYPGTGTEPVFGHQLKGRNREALIEQIRAQPHAYVAQEWVRLSQAPVWRRDSQQPLAARSIGLRLFAAATADGYTVMPGALTRVASRDGAEVISMQRGGLSKDTWVEARRPARRVPLTKPRLSIDDLLTSERDTPSRVGENLFWMGRHSERSEMTSRILRAAFTRLATNDEESEEALTGLRAAGRRLGILPPLAPKAKPEVGASGLLEALINRDQPGSLAYCLQALALNASQLRDRLSTDNWHLLSRLELPLQSRPSTPDKAIGALNQVILDCISLGGFAMDDITRDADWCFLIAGRRLERLINLCSLLQVPLQAKEQQRDTMLEWLLEVTNSSITYRTRYRRAPELLPVLHLLITDRSNTHAVAFQIVQLQRDLPEIANATRQLLPPDIELAAQSLQQLDLRPFAEPGADQACEQLATTLGEIIRVCYNVAEQIQRQSFSHTAGQRTRWNPA
ncbi:circularly permuted type 2 ATP-grasp protein [uncultured Marinobacter sp.]|uniref:circularly permuted type 2 ATP-grasp protein n=1 Tax=uncultured Marinobacter sp. TaxID=187379 RepID=UPI0030D8BB51